MAITTPQPVPTPTGKPQATTVLPAGFIGPLLPGQVVGTSPATNVVPTPTPIIGNQPAVTTTQPVVQPTGQVLGDNTTGVGNGSQPQYNGANIGGATSPTAPALATPTTDLGGGQSQTDVINQIDAQNQAFFDTQVVDAQAAYEKAKANLQTYYDQVKSGNIAENDINLQQLELDAANAERDYTTAVTNANNARQRAMDYVSSLEGARQGEAATAKTNLQSSFDETTGQLQTRENQRLVEYQQGIGKMKAALADIQRRMITQLAYMGSAGNSAAAAMAERLGQQALQGQSGLESQKQTELSEIGNARTTAQGEYQRGKNTIETQLQNALAELGGKRGDIQGTYEDRLANLENSYTKLRTQIPLEKLKIQKAFTDAQNELQNTYQTNLTGLETELQQNLSSIQAARLQSAQQKATATLQAWQDYADRKAQLDLAQMTYAAQLKQASTSTARDLDALKELLGITGDEAGSGYGEVDKTIFGPIDNQSVTGDTTSGLDQIDFSGYDTSMLGPATLQQLQAGNPRALNALTGGSGQKISMRTKPEQEDLYALG